MTRLRRYLPAYALIAPAVILWALMAAGPLAMGLYLSLCELSLDHDRYIGLANYARLLADPAFRRALRNTLVYVALIVPVLQVTSLSLALLAHSVGGRLKGALRSTCYVVTVLSGVFTMGLWRWFWHPTPTGGINAYMAALGLPTVNWLARPSTAFAALVVTTVAWNYGGGFVLYLAGLDGQDRAMHDAAKVDGASAWQRLRHVTVPLLRRVVLYQVIIGSIGLVQIWEVIAILTGGGPSGSTRSMGYYLFEAAALRGQFGEASAVAVIELGIILALVGVQNVALRERG